MPLAERALAWTGVAVLVLAAALPAARPVAVLVLTGGLVLLAAGRRASASAWAGAIPVALALAWSALVSTDGPLGDACALLDSPIALGRVGEAALVLGAVALLARLVRSDAVELGLVQPGRGVALASLAIVAVAAVGSVVVGPIVAEPFVGEQRFAVPLAALPTALVFAVANGTLEEVAYRGALRAWLGRVVGAPAAIVAQGVVFGLAHAGPDIVALQALQVTLMTTAGVGAGILAAWTRSLWLPIVVHVGVDVALYYGLACRVVPG